uniref:Uncharacterized protein n=1 Tax=Glossina pallidipes TaxID=7398 RepID=A0A1B0A445_GLOPL
MVCRCKATKTTRKKIKREDKFVLFDGRNYHEVNNGKVEDYPLERSKQTKTNAVLLSSLQCIKFFFQVHTRKQHEIESHACTMHRVLSTAWSPKQQQLLKFHQAFITKKN